MTESASTDNQSFRHDRGNVSQSVESFVADVLQCLSHTDAPESAKKAVKQSGDELVSAVDELNQEARRSAQRVETLEQTVDQLEAELSEARSRNARELAEVRSRVTAVEESAESGGQSPDGAEEPGLTGSNPSSQTGNTGLPDAETALGDTVQLPEHLAEDSLTVNQKRARGVAADVIDYGRSVPAGYAVTSSELRTVLTALDDGGGKAYTETVKRVINYLDELGGNRVTVKETMGGQRTVVFDDEFVKRTVAWRQTSNDVVTEGGAVG